MTQITITAVNNRNLFSNYYLDNQIKSNPEWEKNDHIEAFNKIKKIYNAEFAFLETLNEKQLEQRFFGPIFKILNHTIEVNESTGNKEFPDYAFFQDRNSLDDAHLNKGTNSFYNNAYAIGEVKRWGIELDRFGKDWDNRKRNPSLQIWIYLHDVTPKWGILTNGASWRLYCKDRGRNEYYEIDLPTLLATDNVEEFRYFYYFFRREAFPFQDISPFLERVLQGSVDYANEIGGDLKENVYKAMKKLAEGFFNWSQNGLDIQNEEHRQIVQKNTMLLLYRFLFLLYAEGKGLLDVKHGRYQTYSFYQLKNEVKENMDGPLEQRYLPVGTSLWFKLNDLFRLINLGSKSFGIPENELHVPAYNGGLFDPKKNIELEKWAVGDTFLAEAIDLLSRSRIDDKLDFVDYSTLEIRHLGSIYEGLLEYKLQIAEEDKVVKSGEWVTLEEYNENRKRTVEFSYFDDFNKVKTGQLYLATDKGERKSTGSYYTPDYIVDYIVENTIGPVNEEKWKEAGANGHSFVDATLSIKVLDPAMGSGHFLVGAIEFLSGKLLQAVQCDIEVERIIDDAHYTPDWAHREVVAHCIYGVDLNEMAVELAKVSLWLTTISKDKPLSFLDHRLKQGNSLIGAHLSDIKNYPGTKVKQKDQTSLPSFISPIFITHLIGKIAELETIGDETLEDIKKKEKVFEEFKQLPEYRKAKALANVYTSVYFGNEVTPTQNKDSASVYYDLFWAIKGDENEWRRKTNREWFSSANQIAEDKSFFHWELEFPEIFFEGGASKENPRWDAIIGNPPYIESKQLTKEVKDELKHFYRSGVGKFDLFIPFIERGLQLLSKFGFFAYICPSMFMKRDYGKSIRNVITQESDIVEIIDFQDMQSFGDVTNFVIILLLAKRDIPFASYTNLKSIGEKPSELPRLKKEHFTQIPQEFFGDTPWVFVNSSDSILLDKIKSKSSKLKEITEKISVGIQTGKDEVFLFSDKEFNNLKLEQNIWKDLLRGRDIDRWVSSASETKVFYPYDDDNKLISEDDLKCNFPYTYNYLLSKRDKLEGRSYFDKSNKKWYELWCERDISIFKCNSKILVQEISNRNNFCIDFDGNFYNTKVFGIKLDKNVTESDSFVLALLNSKLLEFSFRSISVPKAGGFFEYKTQFLNLLPIRRISFTTPPERRTALLNDAKTLYSEYFSVSDRLLDFVASRLAAEPEESDVVHDLLAHMAEQMIEMNKDKIEEIKTFLEWFEREISVEIDSLTNKTKLKQFYELDDFDEFLDILKKNKKKIPINLSNRDFQNILKIEFDKSLSVLEPLINQLENTDCLIDQVVCKLYGLTDDEIKIVEESVSDK